MTNTPFTQGPFVTALDLGCDQQRKQNCTAKACATLPDVQIRSYTQGDHAQGQLRAARDAVITALYDARSSGVSNPALSLSESDQDLLNCGCRSAGQLGDCRSAAVTCKESRV